MSRETKLTLRSVASVLVILAMLFAFAISGVRLFGLQVFGVLTGSMEPSYPTGSLVYVKAVDPASLKVSDVITFSMSRNVVATHRIVEKVPDPDTPYAYAFRTKGDANANVDTALVRQSNIIGKVVFSLPMMGTVASYIQNPPGTYVAIFVSLLLIAFVFLTDSVEEQSPAPKRKERAFLPPALRGQIDPLIEKYLPFLNRKKQAPNSYLYQGYSPVQQAAMPQQMAAQQYPPYPQQQAYYPQQAAQQLPPYPCPQQPYSPYQPYPLQQQAAQPYPPQPYQQQAAQPYPPQQPYPPYPYGRQPPPQGGAGYPPA